MFNKLVWDRIPETVESSGEVPITRVLELEVYLACLEAKLNEEVQEFHESKDSEELADILEVVYALADTRGCSRQKLAEILQGKHDARGGFSKRIFLIGKTKND